MNTSQGVSLTVIGYIYFFKGRNSFVLVFKNCRRVLFSGSPLLHLNELERVRSIVFLRNCSTATHFGFAITRTSIRNKLYLSRIKYLIPNVY